MIKLKALLLILSMTLGSLTLDAQFHEKKKKYERKKRYEKRRRDRKEPVKVPLDGGLLSILGAAGVGYFVIRRKKNQQ